MEIVNNANPFERFKLSDRLLGNYHIPDLNILVGNDADPRT